MLTYFDYAKLLLGKGGIHSFCLSSLIVFHTSDSYVCELLLLAHQR